MAIFKFYQIFRSIKEELGEEMALSIFPEYPTLPDKMPAHEQAKLGSLIMDRMDQQLDKTTIARIRQKHCCNVPKQDVAEINRLKEEYDDIDKIIEEYSKFVSPGQIIKTGNLLTVSFGWGKCVCGMFRKLETYEPVSKSWCECCNGNVKKIYSLLCSKPVDSKIIEAVACGDKDCVFEVKI
jgi:hypothetical protein